MQSEYVGYFGNGTFTQSGGTNATPNANGTLYLGYNSGSNGYYNLSGNGTLNIQSENIGNQGNGTFSQTGGTNSVTALSINALGTYTLGGTGTLQRRSNETFTSSGTFTHTGGTNTISTGLYLAGNGTSVSSYSLSGTGSLTASTEIVGGYSVLDDSVHTGNFTQSAGTNTVGTGGLILGQGIKNRGNYTLTGTGAINASNETIGMYGTGNFTHSAGTNTIGTGGLLLANNANSTGSYTLSGTAALTASSETIGANGTATFTQIGGTNIITTGGLTLANSNTSIATYTLTSPGYLAVSGNETLANATGASATFIQTGGTHIVNSHSTLTIAAHAGATAAYTLLGDGELNAYAESIASPGNGAFTQSGGLNSIGHGGLLLGNGTGSLGNYTLLGSGDLSAAANETIGANFGTATFNQSGGINSIAAPSALIISDTRNSTGTYTLTGGSLTTPTIQINPGGTFSQTAGTLSVTSLQLLGGAASFQNTTAKLSSLTFTGSTNNWTGQVDLANATSSVGHRSHPLPNKTTLFATLQNQALLRPHPPLLPASETPPLLPSARQSPSSYNARLGYSFFNGQPVDATSILLLPRPPRRHQSLRHRHHPRRPRHHPQQLSGKTTSNWTDGNFDGAPTIDLTLGPSPTSFSTTSAYDKSPQPLHPLQPSSFSNNTPEPATLCLLVLATLPLPSRRRPAPT